MFSTAHKNAENWDDHEGCVVFLLEQILKVPRSPVPVETEAFLWI